MRVLSFFFFIPPSGAVAKQSEEAFLSCLSLSLSRDSTATASLSPSSFPSQIRKKKKVHPEIHLEGPRQADVVGDPRVYAGRGLDLGAERDDEGDAVR